MRAPWLGVGGLLALGACATEPQRDLFSVVGVVRGTVVAAEQIPVRGAQVVGVAEYTAANGHTVPVSDSVRTDASGRYVVTLQLINVPDVTIPAQILVRGDGGQPAAQSGSFMVQMTASAARDTVVADVVVGP